MDRTRKRAGALGMPINKEVNKRQVQYTCSDMQAQHICGCT